MTPDKQPSKENAGIHVFTPYNKMRTCNSTYIQQMLRRE